MILHDFKCANCNPTVFNPQFRTKCEYCVNLPSRFFKHTNTGVSDIFSKQKGR